MIKILSALENLTINLTAKKVFDWLKMGNQRKFKV